MKPTPNLVLVDDTGTTLTVLTVTKRAVRCRETYTDGGEQLVSMDHRAWSLKAQDVAARKALAALGAK